jgi:hypothetical protein
VRIVPPVSPLASFDSPILIPSLDHRGSGAAIATSELVRLEEDQAFAVHLLGDLVSLSVKALHELVSSGHEVCSHLHMLT